ncbi:MAG: hypothetical protein ACMUJM_05385 [bacterium]
MSFKRLLSLITLVLFIFAVSFMSSAPITRADEYEDDIVVGKSVNEGTRGDHGMVDEEDAERSADLYQHDTMTSPWGEVIQTWHYEPDVGYGEVGEGYIYTNPLTGESVSYQVTGMGMGAIPLPIYGGMGSEFGQASYGIFSTGQIPVVQSTPGVYTETSTAGSAFGEGYQYAASRPDPTAMMATSLMQNPSTAALGYALAYTSGGLGSFSLPTSFGGVGGIGGLGSSISSFGSLGGIRSIGGLGISSRLGGLGSFGGLGISSGLGSLGYSGASYGINPGYSAYSGGLVTAPPVYGSAYAPSYGGGYTAAPTTSAYAPYGYQSVPATTQTQATQQYAPQYQYYY